MSHPLGVSVIVPARGASEDLARSLAAIRSDAAPGTELILVDDGSPVPLSDVAQTAGFTVVRLARTGGPGAARNAGAAAAKGEILFFVDADVVIPSGAIARVARVLAERPEFAALFGSYDDAPSQPDFLSQYKNLMHRYIHQIAGEEAGTFWAGCGAIRRAAFIACGGFDAARYPLPSIEDIELGVRLRREGKRILVDKGLQAKHLKRWDLRTLLVADIARRAIPWTQLILRDGSLPGDLNLKGRYRLSALLAALVAASIPTAFFWRPALWIGAAALLAMVFLNLDVYRYFFRLRGLWFAVRVVPMHLFYYLYSGATFVAVTALHRLGWGREPRRGVQHAPPHGVAPGAENGS